MDLFRPIASLTSSVVRLFSSTTLPDDMVGHAAKKRKTADVEPANEVPLRSCYIHRLPAELVADILSYMTTPKEILNLARCSKFFCDTLTHKDSSFIWRRARKRCIPEPIPEPTPNFTEAGYAAFIFDGGRCTARDLHYSRERESRTDVCGCRCAWVQRSTCCTRMLSVFDCVARYDARTILTTLWMAKP